MVRAQIQFEEQQYESVRRLAHRKKISISEAVRRLVKAGLQSGLDEEACRRSEGLLKIAGIAGSGTGDLGRRHDHYLALGLDTALTLDRHFRDQGFSTLP